jgi:amino acid transporter
MSAEPTAPAEPATGPQAARLGLWDAVSLIVGIVVGASIFQSPPMIFGSLPTAAAGLGVWVLGGALALCGAFCYAELATSLPRSGGDYVYLTRAYSPLVGFLFGWAHLTGILTGSIGALAYVFAEYAAALLGTGPASLVGWAVAAVAATTVLNVVGIAVGKTAQNVLTAAKVLGLLGVAVCGLLYGDGLRSLGEPARSVDANFGLAMVLVLYAYGGWSDAAFVAAEVRERERNLPWALFGGVGLVTVVYLLINAAYLNGLGHAGLAASKSPAADVMTPVFGRAGFEVMCVLVMVSTLGGLNGLVLTGSRVHASLGRDYRLLGWLGRWQRGTGAPIPSLLTQGTVAVLLVLAVGPQTGRGVVDGALDVLRVAPVDWSRFGSGFDALVAATAPVFWTFFLLTGLAVFVLRRREPDLPRPYRIPLFPLTPIVFCLTSAYMLYASINYAGRLALLSLIPVACGLPLYALCRRVQHGGERAA